MYDNKVAKTMIELECMKINYAPYMIKEQVIPFVRELQFAQNLKMLILRFPSTRFYDVERWVLSIEPSCCMKLKKDPANKLVLGIGDVSRPNWS